MQMNVESKKGEISFKRDLNRNYFVISYKEKLDDYKTKMLNDNIIPGLLDISIRNINGRTELYYDISSRQAMDILFMKRKMTADDIRKFVFGLARLLESTQEYLLNINSIRLHENEIYLNQSNMIPEFIYDPYESEDFEESLMNLLQNMLLYVDHENQESVLLAYGLQEIIYRDNYTIEEMLNFVSENKDSPDYKNLDERFDNLTQFNVDKNNLEYNREKTPEDIDRSIWDLEEYPEENQRETKRFSILGIIKNWISKKKKIREAGKFEKRPKDAMMGDICDDTNKNSEDYPKDMKESERCESCYEPEVTTLLIQDENHHNLILHSMDMEKSQDIITDVFPLIIGKVYSNVDFVISNKMVSRMHAKIDMEKDTFYVEDLNSTNGTYVNGERLDPHIKKSIKRGDSVKFANISFVVQ